MEDEIKRVLFIITQSEMGGAQRFLYTLIPHLDKGKYEIMVAAGPKEKAKDYPLLENLEQENIKTFPLKYVAREINPWKDIRAVFELRKLIKSWQPDVLFLNSSKAGFLGSLAVIFPFKLATRNRKLVTIYRIGGWTFNDPRTKWKKNLSIFRFYR